MTIASAAIFLLAFWVSLVATAVMMHVGPKWGLVDYPAARKMHRRPMPLGGGLAIWLGVVVTVGFAYLVAAGLQTGWIEKHWVPEPLARHAAGLLYRGPLVAVVLLAATAQFLLGLIDDLRGLSYGFRLLAETVLVAALVVCGIHATLFPPLDHPIASGVLTVLWVVGLTNAFNFLDNMDGLSGGVACIVSVLLCAVAYLIGDLFIGGFSLVLAGALLGFLVFNRPPARIFMGDAGSNFVGFLLGVVTVAGTFTAPEFPRVTIVAPLCLMAVPIYDSLSVIFIRLKKGQSPFFPDKNHFSHRLVALGLTPAQAVVTIYLVTFCTGASALMLYYLPWRWSIWALLQIASILGVVAILEAAGLRHRGWAPAHEPSAAPGPRETESVAQAQAR
jgi:UDP-GlcNAc:undecaprenyl-phosphate GlcNAc-1-phosphate transferase